MKSISELDKNFKTSVAEKDDVKFYDINKKPFKIYGVFKSEEECKYIRIPSDIAKATSNGVEALNTNTAGGRIRFKTNSKYIILRCITDNVATMPHMALTGVSGFDLYADKKYSKTFIPPFWDLSGDYSGGYESIVEFDDNKMRDIIINFPLYCGVNDVILGFEESAEVLEGKEYAHKTPVVFYGSSITQGGCASRPGNSYQSILSRHLDFDFINLGFSGNAKGEDSIAEYIAGLDMSAFVYDYDHNAPTVEHLQNTHYKMYKKIRDMHPNMPIIMASSPNTAFGATTDKRIEIIKETLKKAKSDGDNNIYFISGQDIFNSYESEIMTVDGCHPNDFGFFCMAEAFEKILKNVL